MFGKTTVATVDDELELSKELKDLDDDEIITVFAGLDVVVARCIALFGMARCRDMVVSFGDALGRAMDTVAEQRLFAWDVATWLLNYSIIAQSADVTTDHDVQLRWLNELEKARPSDDDVARRSLALASLALGEPAMALTAIRADMPASWTPGRTFEFNTFGFIRYLAYAISNPTDPGGARPAWEEYVALFPLNLAANAAVWPDLIFAGFAIARIERDSTNDVPDLVFSSVHQHLER